MPLGEPSVLLYGLLASQRLHLRQVFFKSLRTTYIGFWDVLEEGFAPELRPLSAALGWAITTWYSKAALFLGWAQGDTPSQQWNKITAQKKRFYPLVEPPIPSEEDKNTPLLTSACLHQHSITLRYFIINIY